jgi:hypothetical protein
VVRLFAEGHAGWAESGKDIVCAGASVWLRSVCQSIETIPGIKITGSADKKGDIRLNVIHIPSEMFHDVQGITRVLLVGLEGLKREFPGSLDFELNEIEE